jgi:hypothetical protein
MNSKWHRQKQGKQMAPPKQPLLFTCARKGTRDAELLCKQATEKMLTKNKNEMNFCLKQRPVLMTLASAIKGKRQGRQQGKQTQKRKKG